MRRNASEPLTCLAHERVGGHSPSSTRRIAEHAIRHPRDEGVRAALEEQVGAGAGRDHHETSRAGLECEHGLALQPIDRDGYWPCVTLMKGDSTLSPSPDSRTS